MDVNTGLGGIRIQGKCTLVGAAGWCSVNNSCYDAVEDEGKREVGRGKKMVASTS